MHGSSLDDDANVPAGALVVKLEATAAPARLWSETTSWQAGRWYSFAVVWDPDTPSERHLYVDGALDEGGAQPGLAAISAASGQLVLGQGLRENADGQLVTTGFAGALDDLMVYRRKLTPSEIAAYDDVAELCAP